MKTESRRRVESGPGPAQIALYHVMFTDEGFDRTAEMLFTIVREAARAYPGRPRALFLDIEGHRPSPQAGYDHDAFEIMSSFVLGFLSPWLTEINTPLLSARMTKPQSDDVPDRLHTIEITADPEQARELAVRMDMPIFHSDAGEWIGTNCANTQEGCET